MESLLLRRPQAFLRYFDFPGPRPPLVFLHGLGCASSMDFPRVVAMPALVGHHSVLVDLLGHGYSDGPQDFNYSLEEHAQTVAELLEHLALRECALFGHSMGGAVAITLAALRPELVSRLVIAEGNLDPGGGIISTAIATQTEEVFKTRGRQAVVDKALEAGSMTRVASFRACAPHAFVRSAAGLVRGTQPTMRERLYSLSIPRAYLFGEKGLPDPEPKFWRAMAYRCSQSQSRGMIWRSTTQRAWPRPSRVPYRCPPNVLRKASEAVSGPSRSTPASIGSCTGDDWLES